MFFSPITQTTPFEGGLDNYILNTSPGKLDSAKGESLRQQIRRELARAPVAEKELS